MLNNGDILENRYRILSILGGGSFGTVYLVEAMNNPQERWALKELEETTLPENERADARELFRRESELLCTLHHKGLPAIREHFSIESRHYIVMEYIEGETLEEIMKKRGKPFSFENVKPWAIQIAEILEYLHQQRPRPVIFRDLKPSNIMRDATGEVKLIDFGIARSFDPQKLKDTYFMGTPGFSPPEQYGLGQSDIRADIFSCGATLYYLLTNEDMASLNFTYRSISSINPDVPRWLDQVVLKCLSKNPGERYQSASELLRDLRSTSFAGEQAPTQKDPGVSISGGGGAGVTLTSGPPPPSRSPSAFTSHSPAKLIWSGVYIWASAVVVLLISLAAHFDFEMFMVDIGGMKYVFYFLAAFLMFTVISRHLNSVGGHYNIVTQCDITIALIIVLFPVLILLPNFMRARVDGHMVGCKSNLKNIGMALEDYANDNDTLYPYNLQDLTPGYLKNIPTCYAANKPTYEYAHDINNEVYTLFCQGKYHRFMSPENYPQYDSIQGLIENYY